MLTQAYQLGFACGYTAVDTTYNCAAGCEAAHQRREAEEAVWEEACGLPVEQEFEDQPAIDDADARCSPRRVVVCEDVGQEIGSDPDGCTPFDPPTFGVPVEGNYRCPSGLRAPEGKLCICCDDAPRSACRLQGGFCRDDDDCCGGRCALETPDAGFLDDAGTPFPNRGRCEGGEAPVSDGG